MFCKYKNILGEPGTGAHKYRFFNLAIVDILLTIISAYFIYLFLKKKYNFIQILITLFLLGIFMHRLFCVKTTIDKFIFRK